MNTETRYLRDAYGLQADTTRHTITRNGYEMHCLTLELPALLAEGWKAIASDKNWNGKTDYSKSPWLEISPGCWILRE